MASIAVSAPRSGKLTQRSALRRRRATVAVALRLLLDAAELRMSKPDRFFL